MTKTTSILVRLTEDDKALFKRAAALERMKVNPWMLSTLRKRSGEILEEK